MSKITKKQFLADVMHEIEMLKKHATPEEIARLDFEDFNPTTYNDCIYGQLTTDCRNNRAKELMDVACIRTFDLGDGEDNELIGEGLSFAEAKVFINGNYDGSQWTGRRGGAGRSFRYLSSLEGYISLKDAKNRQIIAYLKGEQPTLTL